MPEKQKMRMSPLDGGSFAVAFFVADCRPGLKHHLSFLTFILPYFADTVIFPPSFAFPERPFAVL